MDKKSNIDRNTPIACLTYGQFIDALKASLEEPLPIKKELPQLLTVHQLAELTGYSKTTIYIKNSNKKIPGCKKNGTGRGSRVLFETEKILEWIESGAVKTQEETLEELERKFREKRR